MYTVYTSKRSNAKILYIILNKGVLETTDNESYKYLYIIQCLFVQCMVVQCLLYSGVISLHFLQEPVSAGASELSSWQLLAVTISLYSREGGERGGEGERERRGEG